MSYGVISLEIDASLAKRSLKFRDCLNFAELTREPSDAIVILVQGNVRGYRPRG